MTSIDHDTIECNSLLCETEGEIDVFDGRRVVEVDGDGHRSLMRTTSERVISRYHRKPLVTTELPVYSHQGYISTATHAFKQNCRNGPLP